MAQLNTIMEIFKLLDQSNCRKCDEPTCLAFAAAVFKGDKQLAECPGLESEILERYGGKEGSKTTLEEEAEQAMEELKGRIATIDLAAAAERLEAKFSDEKLTIKCLGKDFSVDAKGKI